jgi:hypothetical protein
MIVCEFCQHYQKAACRLGLNLPKAMSCREFAPSMQQFCSNPQDFVDPGQIMQMARFFGFQRTELKKITLMAAEEERSRAQKRFNEDTDVGSGSELSGLLGAATGGGAR